MSTQSPTQEAAERVAEAAPGLAVAAHMEAVQHFRQSNADYRRRLRDSHRWNAESLGMTAEETPEEDPVGNLIVTGDVYGSDAAEIIRSLQSGKTEAENMPTTPNTSAAPPAAAPPTEPSSSNLKSNLAKAAIVVASVLCGGGMGAGIPWLAGAFDRPPAAVSAPATSQPDGQRIEIEVVPGGAEERP